MTGSVTWEGNDDILVVRMCFAFVVLTGEGIWCACRGMIFSILGLYNILLYVYGGLVTFFYSSTQTRETGSGRVFRHFCVVKVCPARLTMPLMLCGSPPPSKKRKL